MAPKQQATLGYVKSGQQTLGCGSYTAKASMANTDGLFVIGISSGSRMVPDRQHSSRSSSSRPKLKRSRRRKRLT